MKTGGSLSGKNGRGRPASGGSTPSRPTLRKRLITLDRRCSEQLKKIPAWAREYPDIGQQYCKQAMKSYLGLDQKRKEVRLQMKATKP